MNVHKRAFLKAVSYRTLGTLFTILLVYSATGDLKLGIGLGGFDILIKLGLYYVHERVWDIDVKTKINKNKMKKTIEFLTLPSIKIELGLLDILRHVLAIILFSGLGYFIIAMLVGSVNGDVWMYIQSVEKHPNIQAMLILAGVGIGHIFQAVLNKLGDYFFHYWKFDKYFYPIAFIVTYLVINEIWGF